VALSQTVLSLEHIDIDSKELFNDRIATQPDLQLDTLQRALSFRQLGHDLDKDLEDRVAAFKNSTGTSDLALDSDRVKITKDDEISGGLRSFGTVDSNVPVIIEWKRYDLSWKGQKGIRLRGRIQNIARLLHAESKPEELLTLNCLGVFEDVEKSRYGLVFEYPLGVTEQENLLSLQSLIKFPTPETLPSLGDRYRMAYTLSLSLAILHASGWLHKSVRSHNIMFPIRNKKPVWSRPYLVGFEFSRPDSSDEATEKPEQSIRFNLYRHPSAQGIPGESFRKGFDIYSLGVVLVEVGLWRLAWSLRRDGESPNKFREVVIDRVNDRLAHFVGTGYQEATLSCLNGDLDQKDGSVIRAFYNEVVETMCSLAESQL
jgi:serine/threonine protein kinase